MKRWLLPSPLVSGTCLEDSSCPKSFTVCSEISTRSSSLTGSRNLLVWVWSFYHTVHFVPPFKLQKALMRLFYFISFSQAAQAIGGVFIGALVVIMLLSDSYIWTLSLPSLTVNRKIHIGICSTEIITKNVILYLICSQTSLWSLVWSPTLQAELQTCMW